MHLRLIGALLLLGCGSAPPAARAAPAPAPTPAARASVPSPAPTSLVNSPRQVEEDPMRRPLSSGLRGFCMHGGAPLVADPLVDTVGRLYLVTQDGYLHGYEADGRFRYSFTVSGTPLGSPSLRARDNAVLLGTTARSVYGIASDGQLSFRAHTVTPVWSGLHARDAESVVYVGLDRFLYALSNRGAALYRVLIPGQPVGEPEVAPGGVVWIPLDSGLARIEQALSVRRFPLRAPVDQLALGARAAFALSGGSLWSFLASGVVTEHGAAETLVSDGTAVLALAGDGSGAWFPTGDPQHALSVQLRHALRPSGSGGLFQGRALLPLDTGEVAWLDLSRLELSRSAEPELRRQLILTESLALATFAPGGARMLVTTRSGRACLLDDPFALARSPDASR